MFYMASYIGEDLMMKGKRKLCQLTRPKLSGYD